MCDLDRVICDPVGEIDMEVIQVSFSAFWESFSEYSGGSHIWLLYPVALVIIFLFGKPEDKKFFIGSFLVQFLILLNPFIFYLLKQKFHFGSVRYQRFFWLLLFFITISYAILLLAGRMKHFLMKALVLAISAGMILLTGTPVFTGADGVSGYMPATNIYYVDNEILALNALFHSEGLERPRILYGMLMLSYRQYDPTVTSVLDRELLMAVTRKSRKKFLKSKKFEQWEKDIARVYFYHEDIPMDIFYQYLSESQCDYIVSGEEELDAYLEKGPFSLLGETTAYRVWKVEKE